MACRFGWCETPTDLHIEDPTNHTREVGHGMLLAVNVEGQPISNWMPDWSEWWINRPDEIDTEYASVADMLRNLSQTFRAFRDALASDPEFAAEVAAMKERER